MENTTNSSSTLSEYSNVDIDTLLNSPPSKIRRVEMQIPATGVPEMSVITPMDEDDEHSSNSKMGKESKTTANPSGNCANIEPGTKVNTSVGESASQTDQSAVEYGVAGHFDIEGTSDYSENMNEANEKASLPSNNENAVKMTTGHLDSPINVVLQMDQGAQSPHPLDDLDENELWNILECKNEYKSAERLLQDYIDNEPCRQLTEQFFRTSIPTYLKASLEDINNKSSYNELMSRIKTADFFTFMKTFTAMLEHNTENSVVPQSPHGENDESVLTEASTQTESLLPAQIPLCFSQEIQTDELQSNSVGVQVETDKDVVYQRHLDQLDESLFTDMRAVSGRESNPEKKIAIIGKMLFRRYFSDDEILEGFKRKQIKNDGTETQAYDIKRVFVISQVIKFMLVETKMITAENFKSTVYENQGLEGKQYGVFTKSVIVDYANSQRNRIKKNQAMQRGSSDAN